MGGWFNKLCTYSMEWNYYAVVKKNEFSFIYENVDC